MTIRFEFEVHGPFEIPLDKSRRAPALSGFWRGELEQLAHSRGCYVVAIERVKGEIVPCYVGLTKRQSFRAEVFNRDNRRKFAAAIADDNRVGLVMFLVTPRNSKGKLNRSYISELESFLIGAASARNPELQNWKGVDRPKWLIRGVTGRKSGKPPRAALKFRAALGID